MNTDAKKQWAYKPMRVTLLWAQSSKMLSSQNRKATSSVQHPTKCTIHTLPQNSEKMIHQAALEALYGMSTLGRVEAEQASIWLPNTGHSSRSQQAQSIEIG